MKYRLVYTRRAEKDIRKLDPAVKRHIDSAIVKLENDPIGVSVNIAAKSGLRGMDAVVVQVAKKFDTRFGIRASQRTYRIYVP